MGDKSDSGDKFRGAMAAQLSSGEYHDFVISCGGHDLKVHRNIIAAHSDFFRASVGPSFSEGAGRTLNLPDDDPALVARMLAFMYTREYCTRSLTTTPSGLELAQFREIVDVHVDESDNWRHQTLLHRHVFALADKYNVTELRSTAFAGFSRSLNDLRNDHEDGGNGELTPFSAEAAQDIAAIFQAVYSSTPVHVRELRDETMNHAPVWDKSQRIFDHNVMRRLLLEAPEIAHDLAIVNRQVCFADCNECTNESFCHLGLCLCGRVGIATRRRVSKSGRAVTYAPIVIMSEPIAIL